MGTICNSAAHPVILSKRKLQILIFAVNFKKTASFLHLWLGLLSGLVVFISLTAASVFVWQEELTNWYYHDSIYVKATGGQKKPISELLNAARRVVKDGPVGYVNISIDPIKAYVFAA